MAVTERRRRRLFDAAERVLGTEEAEILMELVPAGLEPATRADLTELRTELKGDIADLRAEMAELRAELKGDIADLRAELKGDIADLRAEMADLRTELKGDIASAQRQLTVTLLVVTLAHLGVTTALITSLGS